MTAAPQLLHPLESPANAAPLPASFAAIAAEATLDPSSPIVILIVGGPDALVQRLEDLLSASDDRFRLCRTSHSPEAVAILGKGGIDAAVVFDELTGRSVLQAATEGRVDVPVVMVVEDVDRGSHGSKRTSARLAGAAACVFAAELNGALLETALFGAVEARRMLTAFDSAARASRARDPVKTLVAAAAADDLIATAKRRAELDEHYRLTVVYVAVRGLASLPKFLAPDQIAGVRSGFAHRIVTAAGTRATCSHYEEGGFVVCLEGYETDDEDLQVIDRIKSAVREPFRVEEDSLSLDVQVGIGRYRRNGSKDPLGQAKDAATRPKDQPLIRAADLSGSYAREPTPAEAMHERLQQAIGRNEFAMRYQPVVALDTGELVGLEALIRWHEDGAEAETAAADFIPAAANSDVIIPIGYWAIETAVRQMVQWERDFELDSALALRVNLSARQVEDPLMIERLRSLLMTTGLDPRALKVEIPLPVASTPNARAFIEVAADAGVGVWLEAIGHGMKARAFVGAPIEGLKIDRAAVAKIDGSTDGATLARSMITAAEAIEADVIAVAVENRLQANYLQWLGCNRGQGYLWAPPLAVGDAYAAIARVANSS